ncbi:IPT/TIG domain-containing protein [Dyella sp. 333MFSha]|uniref:IPT/TIG domain-containing protein n=1 Tax=Dyella sp. 333MFSha TaxID=1798240 RepID=UPI00088DD6DA|nr:IPT/TIG domain-containing protein [Dyella sp. 333MFSha]SDG78215.1 YD repeat-containing protein [Dyella sp. 333MFSha]
MISQRTRASRACRTLASWLALGLVLMLSATAAQATNYVYDANGRLVVVTNDDGESARYVYDVMGNIVRIERVEASELRIFAMTPTHGTIDSAVSIRGQGFSSALTNNAVSFNGSAATVTSATANELKVTVPYTATTGPVTVTVGARTATSDTPFTIDDTGLPPSVGTVTPDIAVVGDSLAVSGSHLYPIPGKTSLRLGGRSLDIAQGSTNAGLNAVLPGSASSGRVSVQTPYGVSESVQTVLVVPTGVDPAAVASRGVATLDTSSGHVDLANGSTYGAVMFDSQGKSWISLQLSNMSGSSGNVGYSVYAPGNVLLQQGSVSANAPSIHLNRLQGDGTYLILFKTNDGGSSSFDVSALSNIALTDQATTLSTSAPSQSVRATFAAQMGETLVVKIAGATTSPSNAAVTYSVYTPSGAFYTSGVTSTTGSINLPSLPTTGTWQLVAAPGVSVTGNMIVSVIKGTTGVLVPGPDPVHLDAHSTGQNVYMDFHADAFDSVELTLANVQLADTTQTYYEVHVYAAAGNEIAYAGCSINSPGASCNMHLWYLTEGDYRVVVLPYYGGTLHLDTYLQKHLVGPALARDTTSGIDLEPGQAERFTFDANAGDTVALFVSSVRTVPTGQNLRFLVYRPDAGGISTQTRAYTDFSTTGTRTVDLPDLPVSGRYTVIVLPDYGLAGAAQLSVLSGSTKTLEVNADPTTIDTHAPGQSAYVEFNAAAGESVEFTLTDAVLTGASYNQYQVDVRDSAGRNVASRTCSANDPGCEFHLWYLPQGRYRVTISMQWGGTIYSNVGVRDVRNGRALTVDAPTNVTLARGQAEHLTFHANAGDTLAFAVNSVATLPVGQNVRYILYRPDAGAISGTTPSYTEFSTTGPRLIDLPSLPVTGDYTLAVVSDYGTGITTQVQLLSGVVGSLPADGTMQTFETHGSGQSTYVDFTARAGESLELNFSNFTQVGAGYGAFAVDIRDSAGRNLASTTCYTNYPGCEFHLWNLAAGSYRATVTTNWGGTLRFDATAREHKLFSALSVDAPVAVALARGEAGRVTFHANAGDTLALVESDIVTEPVGQNVRFIVYRPDAGTLTTSTPGYTDFTRSGNQLLDLPNLPVTGDYTVLVIPDYGVPATVNLHLIGGSTGTLPADGSTHTFQTNGASQTSYMDFAASSGDNLEVVFSNVVQTGASYAAYAVDIRDQAGRYVGGGTCYSTDPGCEYHLWNLAAGGYRVTLSLNWGGDLKVDVAVRPHRASRVLAFDAPASFDLGTGDVQRLTFHANAGDTLALQETGIVTTPVGRDVRFLVYRPDAGTITTGTPAYLDFTRSGNQLADLPKLPVTGDYTVLVIPSYGVPAHVRLDLIPGSTATLTTDAIAQTVQVPAAGQTSYVDFHARPFDNLEFSLSNVTQASGSSSYYQVAIYDAANRQVSGITCYYSDPGCESHLWYLAEGNYRAVITLNNAGPAQFDAAVRAHKTGTTLTDGHAQTIILGTGQAERVTFQATAGDTRTLAFQDVVSVPAGRSVRAIVYSPDAGAITLSTTRVAEVAPNGNQIVTLENLPATGTYTVLFLQDSGAPLSFKVTESFVRAAGAAVPKPVTLQVNAAAAHFASAAPGEAVSLVFSTGGGTHLEVALTGVTQDNGQDYYYVNVYDPAGNLIDGSYCYASWPACTRDVWNTVPGTYTVVATPYNGGSIAFDAIARSNVQGGVLARGVAKAIDTSEGDLIRYTFDASQGETVALNLTGVATTPQGSEAFIRVYRPDGGRILPASPYSSTTTRDNTTLNLPTLPVTGTYTVVVNSSYLLPWRGSLTLASGAVGGLLADGVTSHVDSNAPGEVVWFDFDAGSGGNFDVTLSNVTTQDNNNFYYVYVYNAAGAQIDNYYCYSSDPGCARDFWNLAPGTYRVAISPYYATEKMSFDAVVRRNKVSGTLVPGVAQNIGHATGDVLRYTFQANQGDTVGLHLADITTTPGGRNTTIRVYRPDGGLVTPSGQYASYSTTSAGTLNLEALPSTGTYTVVVSTDYLVTGEGTLTLFAGASGTLLAVDSTSHMAANTPGQNVYFDIDVGSAGNYDLTLSGISSNDNNDSYFQIYVYTEAGVNVDNYYCYPSYPGCARDFWNLAPGKYHVIAQPGYPYSRLSFDAVMRRNVVKGVLQKGVGVDVTHVLGDVLRYTFQASAGDTVALRLSDMATTPAGQSNTLRVYRPDGGLITPSNQYSSFSTRDFQTLNLQNLPSTGIYTVVITSDYLVAGKGTLTLIDGAAGSTIAEGVVTHLEGNAPGQNVYFDADFGAGGNVDLTLSGISTNDNADSYFQVYVYNAAGVNIDNYYCYPSYPACPRDYWDAAPGIYHVVVVPGYASSRMSFDTVVRHNQVKGELAFDTPVDIGRTVGDVLRYTFQAGAGDTVALRLSGIVNTPSSVNTNIRVYRPDGGRIQPSAYYSIMGTSSASLLNLPSLPVGGTYTVVVSTDYLAAGQGQLTLVTGVANVTLGQDVVAHPHANAPGQTISMNVDVPTPGNFELTLAPTQDASQSYASVAVFNADGVQVDSYGCYLSDNCPRDFWNFAAGKYRIVVTPNTNADLLGFDARFLRNIERGSLVKDQPADITHALGEDVRFTFQANRKDTVALKLIGGTNTPAAGYIYVRVYRPDGGLITPDGRYALLSSSSGNDTLNLPNLPIDGTYTVVVNSDRLYAGQGTLTLTSGTTP